MDDIFKGLNDKRCEAVKGISPFMIPRHIKEAPQLLEH
jgi:hypothetical protein